MITTNGNTFHLQGNNTSYVMVLNREGDLLHYYFGKKIKERDYSDKIETYSTDWHCCDENGVYLEKCAQEFPAYGYTDLRMPAYCVKNKFGNFISRLVYKGYKIIDAETAQLEGMPSVFKANSSCQTLEITLEDKSIGLETVLSYTVFDDYDVILRSSKLINNSSEDMTIECVYSASVDFEKGQYDFIYFPGSWIREREFIRTEIKLGEKIDISNARGGSGHAANPFVMLCDRNANERYGKVYGFSLIYSGNHSSVAECDQYGNVRIRQGINPYGFESILKSGESFFTPQCVISYSSNGFGGISRQMHDIYRNNLCKSNWSKMDRPILINNWEATYFDFDEDKLISIAKRAKEAGIELFVLDDGWFGKRNDDTSSLGDWYVNTDKLPSGIKGIAEKINEIGLEFGIWFEPESVNPDSELFRNHPEWIISVPNIKPALGRQQYMLDLANDEVCDYIIGSVGSVLESANIKYVKWDYNRVMTDMPYKGYNHKYILGLYKVLDELVTRFPRVLFEGCSGGGGRFDPGMLAYSPQIWTSDNSDAVSRLKIQYSTSMCYPLSAISAHVTASPNHQVGRYTTLKTRADVAYSGIFGYELDVNQMTDEEFAEMKEQIGFYHKIEELIRTGDFYRLQNPYESNYCSWQVVSKDKNTVFLFAARLLSTANTKEERIFFEALDSEKIYVDIETSIEYGGDELMYRGIMPKYDKCDFSTIRKVFKVLK